MICSSNFKVWSVHCHGHLASCGEKLTPSHWRAFQPVFNQRHYTPALPTLVSLFTSATAFRVPTDTQNSVMLSYFDWDSLRFITSKMGWEGWERKKKTLTKHYIKVWQQNRFSHVTHLLSHTCMQCALHMHGSHTCFFLLLHVLLWIFQGEMIPHYSHRELLILQLGHRNCVLLMLLLWCC